MQVFITSSSFEESARVLDTRRLNCQIKECNQMYRAIIGESIGWRNHCVTRLWENDRYALMAFAWECYFELKKRGKNPSKPCGVYYPKVKPPAFLEDAKVVDAMKSHLLAKLPEHYKQYWPNHPVKSGYWAIDKQNVWKMYSVKD